MRQLLLLPIRFYQYCLSPMLPSRCRYYPTCSDYAAQAITQHGAAKGSLLTLKRLLRCHPWGSSGYDPVPGTCSAKHHQVPTTHKPRQ
ncbi:membrane protein insertion efficiency factor YidD [Marinobacter psychrophilus]|jgi:putative membrane protein insertion efficiency factor|uniref:membrane protein insertion efficiency factor YidD n=1 Tax=Marinobacter psychrophilus TaxID=330734 RepID=UPI001B48EC1C|nr:membrane protein insertion efficiency factor YidD [Marinobacter psychrophilus]MBQ0763799.1 membrane protein insertion efficiency factor YidD [Marinobacter psychrophilus]MBQ0843625.1 membrane protein insertion efficiency factor YidD [Marinobacter psychrophilus]